MRTPAMLPQAPNQLKTRVTISRAPTRFVQKMATNVVSRDPDTVDASRKGNARDRCSDSPCPRFPSRTVSRQHDEKSARGPTNKYVDIRHQAPKLNAVCELSLFGALPFSSRKNKTSNVGSLVPQKKKNCSAPPLSLCLSALVFK